MALAEGHQAPQVWRADPDAAPRTVVATAVRYTLEELAARWASVALGVSVHTLACFPVDRFGTEADQLRLGDGPGPSGRSGSPGRPGLSDTRDRPGFPGGGGADADGAP